MASSKQRGRKAPPRVPRKALAQRAAALAPVQGGGERFELAMRAINEGVYDWNVADGSVYYSEAVYAVLHMPRSVKTPAGWRKRIHPDDIATYDAAIVAHFKKKTRRFECDYRYQARDRTWRWARQHGIAMRDKRGQVVRVIGSTGDITELKRVELALAESRERYALATWAATEGIYEWNLETGTLFLSDRAKAFFGVKGAKLTPAAWNARVHRDDFPGYRAALSAYFKGRTPQFEHEYRIRGTAGGYVWVVDRAAAVRNEKKKVIRLVGALADVTQRKLAEIELRRARDEATEALERQSATAEIVKVINNSPADLQPTFKTILESTRRLCESSVAALFLYDGELLTCAAHDNTTAAFARVLEGMRSPPSKDTPTRLAALRRKVVHVHDYLNDKTYAPLPGQLREKVRTVLSVPLLREGKLVGVITTWRREVRPFADKHVALLQTFAAQAVTAIQNVRLFNETREALERQTAISDILRVISESPGDVKPVLDAVLERAARICQAQVVDMVLRDGETIRIAATFGDLGRPLGEAVPLNRTSVMGRSIVDRSPVHVADLQNAGAEFPLGRALAIKYGHRTILAMPLLREGRALGTILVRRAEVRPFEDEHIALLRTFADQAAIAIENVRLFNETKEALERQTATAEILQVIGSSPTDTQPVFDAIVNSGVRLFPGAMITVARPDGGTVRAAAIAHEDTSMVAGWKERFTTPLSRDRLHAAAILDAKLIDFPDAEAEKDGPLGPGVRNFLLSGNRAVTIMPMLRGAGAIGAISVTRAVPGPLSDKQIAILRTFADQAVIAIENVRLFNELEMRNREVTESLERQTATAEILRVISSSPTDTQPVFEAIVRSGLKLFPNAAIVVTLPDGDRIRLAAMADPDSLHAAQWKKRHQFPLTREYMHAVAILDGTVIDVPDAQAYEGGPLAAGIRNFLATGNRAITIMPMLRADAVIGTISVIRLAPGPLTEKQFAMLRTFADQAVIAIENVRLFNETKEALERQTATAEILKVISESPTDVQPVFDAIVESCARLLACNHATLRLVKGDRAEFAASNSSIGGKAVVESPMSIHDDSMPVAHAVLRREVVQIPDTSADDVSTQMKQRGEQRGFRSLMVAPLLRDNDVIGTINVHRATPGRFSEKEVALLETFASQAVIAIENVRLFNETKESLERQTATAEILKVIASSPSDVQPVFEAIAGSALRLIGGRTANVTRRVGDELHLVALTTTSESGDEAFRRTFPARLTGQGVAGKAVLTGTPTYVSDFETDPAYSPAFRDVMRARGVRSVVVVPMIREGEAIGTINVARSEPGQFTDHQINLLKTFADQAVIAIENVRLFNETKEALERQTATADILKVISQSTTDVQPVLEAIVRSAAKLFPQCNAHVFMRDGGLVRLHAMDGATVDASAREDLMRVYPVPFDPAVSSSARAMAERRPNACADTEAPGVPEHIRSAGRAARFRANTVVPLVRDDEGIGSIVLTDPRPGHMLDEKQLALLQTFADQAVIAIENARLFNETKEALEQQTATAEILQVISSSPTDTQPVFEAIAQAGLRLFPEATVLMTIPGGAQVRAVAVAHRDPAVAAASWNRFPLPLTRDRLHSAAILDCTLIDVPDAEAEKEGRYAPGVRNFLASGNRAITIAPMICGDAAIGAISVSREKAGPLSDKQVSLLRTFAAQAVIAIENVRVFKELEARTGALTRSVEQLTALGEVGQAISSTLDLATVLRTIVQRAVQLTGLDGGSIYEYDEMSEEFHLRAAENLSEELVQMLRETPAHRSEGVIGSAVETGQPTEIAEMLDDSYQSPRRDALIQAGYRALLVVPLLREGHIIGALAVNRKTPGVFAHDVVELLKTFATQSAMAIQNARLFREIADKGKQLEEASKHKSNFLASMSHELRTPLNAILGFNEMILGQVYGEVPADMQEPLNDIQTSGKHLLRLINNVLDLAKIEAGRMELSLQDYSVHDMVESVRATLRPLAAEKGLEFLATVPQDLPLAYGDSGRITQCLMNLAGNSLKFTKAGKVEIAVESKGDLLVYQVTDTGIGIPPDKIDGLFTEFKQTDATIASEYGGTGLGLSISKKFVEMHGGRIWIESELGKGSTFFIEVPLRVTTA